MASPNPPSGRGPDNCSRPRCSDPDCLRSPAGSVLARTVTEALHVSSASTLSRPAFRPPLLGKGLGLPVVEDCQQQRPAMRLRRAFMITGIGVHDPPESVFTIDWNLCSRSNGIRVHDPPESAGLASFGHEGSACR